MSDNIGTNDLTQYTLAIDRQNEKLYDFYNPHQFVQMGVDELSVAPSMILKLRKVVRKMRFKELK